MLQVEATGIEEEGGGEEEEKKKKMRYSRIIVNYESGETPHEETVANLT
jgi:hypothetical protein